MISVLCAGLLGFGDNVLNLEWRWKLVVPVFTLVPLCYFYVDHYALSIVFQGWFEITLPKALSFAYIVLFAVFSQNAVNIYAGINGLEIGQSLVAEISLLCHIVAKYGGAAASDPQL